MIEKEKKVHDELAAALNLVIGLFEVKNKVFVKKVIVEMVTKDGELGRNFESNILIPKDNEEEEEGE